MPDADGDARIDRFRDFDDDGRDDQPSIVPRDTDGDGAFDFRDVDSDNDGASDRRADLLARRRALVVIRALGVSGADVARLRPEVRPAGDGTDATDEGRVRLVTRDASGGRTERFRRPSPAPRCVPAGSTGR